MDNLQRIVLFAIFLLGALVVAIGATLDEGDIKNIVIGVGAGVAAVPLAQVPILVAGGEPTEKSIKQLAQRMTSLSDALHQKLAALPDTEELPNWVKDLGIRQIHKDRGEVAQYDRWRELAASAKQIDLMGLTLWVEWFKHPDLIDCLRAVARRDNGGVRVLILSRGDGPHPEEEIMEGPDYSVYVRARQEGELEEQILWNYLESAHEVLGTLRAELRGTKFEMQEMRTKTYPHALIIRINNYMMVAPYMSSEVGERSFAMELDEGPLFDLYMEEFRKSFNTERDEGQASS